jgi:hypothetical protein
MSDPIDEIPDVPLGNSKYGEDQPILPSETILKTSEEDDEKTSLETSELQRT